MNDKYLKESLDVLNRKFGDPLPTLEDTMKAHALKKEGELPPALKKAIAKKKGEEVKEGGKGSGRPAKPGGAKDIDNKMGKAVDDANARLDAAEKAMKKKKKNEGQLDENPIVAATVMHMTKMNMKNPKTGRTIKAITPLKNKEHPLHKKSKGIFDKIKDAMKKKKKVEPKKQSKSDADFYKKQFTGEVTEGPDDKRSARRVLSKIAKTETKFRKEMYELEQAFLQDPRTENKQAAKEIKRAYKDGVTKFMRDSVKLIKGMK